MNRIGALFSRTRSLLCAAGAATATLTACAVLTSSFAGCSSEAPADTPRLEGRYEAVLDPNLQFDNIWFSSDGRYHAWKSGCFDASCHERGTFKLDVDAATLALRPESGAARTYALGRGPAAIDQRPASARPSRGVLTPRAEGATEGATEAEEAPSGDAPSCAPGDGTATSQPQGPLTQSLRPAAGGSGSSLVGSGALVGDDESTLITACVKLTVGKAGLLTAAGGLIVSLNITLILGNGGKDSPAEPSGPTDNSPPTDGSSSDGTSPRRDGGSSDAGSSDGGASGGGASGGGSSGGGSSGGGSSGGGSSGGGAADGGAVDGGGRGGGSPRTPPAPTPLRRTGPNDAGGSTTKGSGSGSSVEDVVQGAACDTDGVLTLTKQIAEQMFCLANKVQPGAYVDLRGHAGLTFDNHAIPYLQKPSANALFTAAKSRPIQVNHATRALSSQYMLFTQGQQGRCGIGDVARVNNSPHEEGIAVDLDNWEAVIGTMKAAGWEYTHPNDPVHFEMLSVPETFRGYSARAFQTLWNINHPEDKIDVDGVAGDGTMARLKRAPAGGFAKGADCSAVFDGPSPSSPPPARAASPGGSTTSSIDVVKELDPHGGPGGGFGKLAIAIGYAEGTLSTTGQLLPAYFGHNDSNLRNIGLWSCTVCGSRNGPEADNYYWEQILKPGLQKYQTLTKWVRQPMVAAMFFGLLVQSPLATFDDANSNDVSLFTALSRNQLSAPLTHEKLHAFTMRAWTVNGAIQHGLGPVAGTNDQDRRLRAYAESLRAQGFSDPFATP